LKSNLADFSHSEILSFTANRRIAEFFANKEGFVIEIDPSAVSVVSAWSTDERLAGKDPVTGREEREWILRVGHHKLEPSHIDVHSKETAWVTRDPQGIAMMATESVRAIYALNGQRIKCRPHWNYTGTKSELYFEHVGGKYPGSFKRAEFKKLIGFDPLPSSSDKVEDLQFYTFDQYSLRADEIVPHLESDEFESVPQKLT